MTIQILPARLANQIAAGEVVERPASVVKELVENSLDAGATKIIIDIEKGGAKRIRISDNGSGIVKNELTLALSRHATSKIKDLNDLEAISSLGFRGEALASISSVARLTLTSKPEHQETAWQAYAQGRDMEVTVQPAAHPIGTTIEVDDLFFNTPARRKFLRTEKTEFGHIDEVIRRIALARFDVSFTLTHNGKTIKQYRAAKDESQYSKRVAAVCGQKFIDNALFVDCQHDNIKLWGWLAQPSYSRVQNDLCYSYVNGRMMRDKLINHAIRQAYADLITHENYPAFVLFLSLDYKEVDVNVHPAKHEVRFHQSRYIHDFIFSVCHKALIEQQPQEGLLLRENVQQQTTSPAPSSVDYQTDRDYVRPLQTVTESNGNVARNFPHYSNGSDKPCRQFQDSYQELMSNTHQLAETSNTEQERNSVSDPLLELGVQAKVLDIVEGKYGVIKLADNLRLLSLQKLSQLTHQAMIEQRWSQGFTSQPLLLPVIITLSKEDYQLVEQNFALFEHIGVIVKCKGNNKIQVRQFPAMLRQRDVNETISGLLRHLANNEEAEPAFAIKKALASSMCCDIYQLTDAQQLFLQAKTLLSEQFISQLELNSVDIDLTSSISQLN